MINMCVWKGAEWYHHIMMWWNHAFNQTLEFLWNHQFQVGTIQLLGKKKYPKRLQSSTWHTIPMPLNAQVIAVQVLVHRSRCSTYKTSLKRHCENYCWRRLGLQITAIPTSYIWLGASPVSSSLLRLHKITPRTRSRIRWYCAIWQTNLTGDSWSANPAALRI